MPKIDMTPAQWAIVKNILQKHVPHHTVWAFGSRAKFTAKPYSDLDLAIVSDKPLSLDTLAALTTAFSESDLPWKVDVLDWASTHEEFQRLIEKDKVALIF